MDERSTKTEKWELTFRPSTENDRLAHWVTLVHGIDRIINHRDYNITCLRDLNFRLKRCYKTPIIYGGRFEQLRFNMSPFNLGSEHESESDLEISPARFILK